MTFSTEIVVDGVTPAGLLFELGDATTAIAAWLDDTTINFRAGDAAAADRAIATFTIAGGLPVGFTAVLTFAINPGNGQARIYSSRSSSDIARGTASGGQLPNGWAAASNGAFAAAAVGALPADVTQTGAPTDFEVIAPLRVYTGQLPRHFV